MKFLPPIGVFAHKRPAHLKRCLEAIVRSEGFLGKKLSITIFCDAAQEKRQQDAVEQTVEIARKFGRAELVVREKNYGFRNITEGISQLCDRSGRAIIIEDDCHIAPDFLPFMCNALERYQDDPRVFMISGFMYFGVQSNAQPTFFLNTPFIWGWGTWKRAWDKLDWDCTGWESFIQEKKNRYYLDCLGSYPFSKMLGKTLTGICNTWDARWMYTVAKEKGLTLYPHKSLVWNCGCGGGTHGKQELDMNPSLGERETYIHGDMARSEFDYPRLAPSVYLGKAFPRKVALDKRSLRYLAIVFLKQRLRRGERKRLWLKFLWQKMALFFTKRP
ncbi:MAG: hypothetical protein WAM28_07030 [Chlamydiales bacterium]